MHLIPANRARPMNPQPLLNTTRVKFMLTRHFLRHPTNPKLLQTHHTLQIPTPLFDLHARQLLYGLPRSRRPPALAASEPPEQSLEDGSAVGDHHALSEGVDQDDPLTLRAFMGGGFLIWVVAGTWWVGEAEEEGEARHRRVLRPLRAEHLPALAARYRSVSEVDLSLCPRVGDGALEVVAGAYAVTLRRLNLSLSRRFTGSGLLSVGTGCGGLVELDLSNTTELRDARAATVAQTGNLRKLWLARCRLVTDMGIGCIAVGCKKTNLCMHAEEAERKCCMWRGKGNDVFL